MQTLILLSIIQLVYGEVLKTGVIIFIHGRVARGNERERIERSLEETQYFFTNAKMGYNEAVNYCKGLEMDLIRINNSQENVKVQNFTNIVGSGAFWISGSDVAEETRWIHTDKNELNYKNWAHDQPNGGRYENCIVGNVSPYGAWDDANCGSDFSVICQISGRNPKELSYNIGSYKLTYNEAIRYCEGLGMDLVIINNATKNMAVFELARKNGFGSYWINGNDIQRETHWVDLYNQRLNFTNWHYSRPNGGRRRNCVQGGLYGIWIDVDCNNRTNVICEVKQYPWLSKTTYKPLQTTIKPTTSSPLYDGPAFILSNFKLTYSLAKRFCKNHNMKIYTMNNETLSTWDQYLNYTKKINSYRSYWINVVPYFSPVGYIFSELKDPNSKGLYGCTYAKWSGSDGVVVRSSSCNDRLEVICARNSSNLWG